MEKQDEEQETEDMEEAPAEDAPAWAAAIMGVLGKIAETLGALDRRFHQLERLHLAAAHELGLGCGVEQGEVALHRAHPTGALRVGPARNAG